MRRLDTGRSSLERWLEAGLTTVFLLALAVNLGNAALRALLDTSMVWGDELQQYALVWLAFMGAALATVQNSHLRVDVIRTRLPAAAGRVVQSMEAVLLPVLCGFATVVSLTYVERIASLGARSEMAGLPMWLPHMAVTLGFGLMTTLELLRLPRKLAEARK
ncbi:MAG: TRAP transporter small permease subunit [Rhizobacter sp.]|nr:TRAP transporter small permease subunit [Rhizobacter sp.]